MMRRSSATCGRFRPDLGPAPQSHANGWGGGWKAGCVASAPVSFITVTLLLLFNATSMGTSSPCSLPSEAVSTGLCLSSLLPRAELSKAGQAPGTRPGVLHMAQQGREPGPLGPAPQPHEADTHGLKGAPKSQTPAKGSGAGLVPIKSELPPLKKEQIQALSQSKPMCLRGESRQGSQTRGAEGSASRSTQGRPQRTLRRLPSPTTQGSLSTAQVVIFHLSLHFSYWQV